MTDWTFWLQALADAGLMALAFVLTYEGARRIVRDGVNRWPALMLAVGLLVPVFEGNASLKVPAQVRMTTLEQSALHAAEPAGGWEKAPLTPEARTTQSTNAALINFLTSGRRGQLIDASGHRVAFDPSPEQLQIREQLVRDQQRAEDAAQQFVDRGIRLFASAAIFMVIGAAVGLFQRGRRPATR